MFNIRVYGVFLRDQHILLSDEIILGGRYTKFPGGGLELGEGTRDCLKREFWEEMEFEIQVGDHIYTTDFYQKSAFGKGDQVISIYYFVSAATDYVPEFPKSDSPLFTNAQHSELFRWMNLSKFSPESVDLPIDQLVAAKIFDEHLSGR